MYTNIIHLSCVVTVGVTYMYRNKIKILVNKVMQTFKYMYNNNNFIEVSSGMFVALSSFPLSKDSVK